MTEIENYIKNWFNNRKQPEDTHIDDSTLYNLANTNGLNEADDKDLEHIFNCNKCFNRWAEWLEAIKDVSDSEIYEEEEDDDDGKELISYGLLEAASTSEKQQSYSSYCGRFNLGIFPQKDNPSKGLVTFRVSGIEYLELEDINVSIRDKNGLVIISGKVREGKLARICNVLDKINMKKWSVIINNKKTEDAD